MDYINSNAGTRSSTTSNPFLIATTDTLEAQLLEEGGLIASKGAGSSTSTPSDPSADFEKQITRLPYAPELVAPWRTTFRRWLAVLSAAIALLLPFLIMMLAPTFASRVVTMCVMVAVFALVMAAGEVETRRAVAYVLGYAGALICFWRIGAASDVGWTELMRDEECFAGAVKSVRRCWMAAPFLAVWANSFFSSFCQPLLETLRTGIRQNGTNELSLIMTTSLRT
jgi:hypothetical protein